DSGCTPFPANPEPADGEINVPTDSLLQWDNLEAPGDLLQSSTSPDPDLTVGSLTTTFAGGNGQDGNMFDLTAKNAITITGWEGNINASGGPATIEVYYVTDHSSFVGKETNPALWTLLGSVTLATTNPRETPTFVEIGGLAIAASETIGIYWTTTSETNVSYTDGPLGVFENADLRFEDRGTGNAYPFGTVFSPRVWNGTIHYEIGGYDTTYDVYFDTDNPPATLIHSGLTDPSCEPIPYPLDDGTTYYWQVVAHNPGGCQADGRVWSFTTAGGGGCSPPGNPEPANGEADVATDLLLQWGVSEYSGFKFQNGGFLSKDQSSLDWKAKPPISEPEKALNANAPANASQDMLLFHQTPHAVSYVAIFQEEDPWGYAINQQVLTQNGIAYVIYDAASMGLVDLSAYDKVIISSVQDPGFYLSLEANKLWFENYVEAGGLLDIHIAKYGEQPVLPGGFEITVLPAEDISIVDTDHPIVTLPNAITEAELNGWNYSVHGYISTVPAGAQEILEITSTGLPCAMELNVGLGSIFVTTQTVEWDGASYNYLENTVLYGADWAEETSVLVYDDYQPNGGFAQEALSNLGIGFVSVGGDQSAFDAQMDVGGWDLVIYDMAGVDINQSSRDRIKSYIESGGRVLMFWWDMDSDASLAASFEAAVVTDIYSPLPVYGPAPLHSIWTTPNIVNLPL
ncbi:MAG: hypothetical protein ACYSPI_10550, partial [Planctomycetota bacterium]